MRYLNKVVFINSASIAYGEVQIDGNVHFIGTQGVGKSTLLRSILFFYNADTLKLGISREKKNFAEYYLPFANSYIVYEVVKETGSFCVLAFKSQGKVCFRFIDAPYNKDLFIEADGSVMDTWDKIRAGLDIKRIDSSRKIDRYDEYRDILYGNNEGKKDLRKYAFLESRQYQNIPRTIQNVFLNSKLEAEFIKETIIHSLNDDDIVIKLDTYQYQLKDFEEQLKDIRQFKQPAVQKQANLISDLYVLIKKQEREQLELSSQLEQAFEQATQQHPFLSKDIQKETSRRQELFAKLEDIKKRYNNKKEKLVGEITLLDDKLKSVKDKKELYSRIDIESIVERVNKKTAFEKQANNLQSEKTLLSVQYQETTQKYNALLKELDNQFIESVNHRKEQQLTIETGLLQQKEELIKQYAALIEANKKQHQQKLNDALHAVEDAGDRLQQAEIKKAETRHKRWYDEDIKQAKEDISTLTSQVKEALLTIQALRSQSETIQKQWDFEEASRSEKQQREKEKHDVNITALQQQVKAINNKLDNTKGSLFEWLNTNKPEWSATIGKVCDEEVLFMNDLNPKIVSEASTLYGVSVDLKEIERIAKTSADYEADKKALLLQVEKHMTGFGKWQEKWDEETTKLHKKIAIQLREHKDETKEQEYKLQQYQHKLENAELALTDWNTKAGIGKNSALEAAIEVVVKAETEKKRLKDLAKKVEDEIEKFVKAKEKEREQKIAEAIGAMQLSREEIKNELAHTKDENNQRKEAIRQQQQNELQASGADTKRLNEIEQQLGILLNELTFIENKRDTVAEYKKDKRELLDKEDEFKNNRQGLQQQMLTEESKFINQVNAQQEEINTVNETIENLRLLLDRLNEDLEEYAGIKQLDWYQLLAVDKTLATASKAKRCKELARTIKEIHYAIIEQVNEVKEVINKFLSHFTSNNIFKFASNLIDKKDYLDFAEKLQQFIEDNRIAEFEKRVNERYAGIIKLIGKETNELTSSEGEIQKIIAKINNDFTQNNSIAVGVIQKIEMKMDESDNKVVQVLKLIQQFNSESGFELGATNLFTQHDSESKNKKAVDLLKQLIREIQNLRRDTISLSDSFEIKFRIVENKNDTGWVERLANVGSEGTDVLVKAMINIMLLNVFKEGASKRFKDFKLHCMMDEIGRLHPVNVRGILDFASARNIWLINGSPTENDALAYRHIYKLEKDNRSFTRVKRILTQHALA
ncbi:MAG: ATP-binding protein [Chitinophagaceae bacterium]|nr:ATP-binding protein [Chitinophagaceae bacterium]